MNEVLPIVEEGVALPLLNSADHQTLVVAYNATAASYPSDRTIIDLFRDRVTRSPDAEAIRFGDVMLTYQQLDGRSNQMAGHLSAMGVGPGRIAVVFMEHSIEVVVAILGVLKSGAAYVPVDAATPKGRIATILTDIANGTDGRSPVVITQRAWNPPFRPILPRLSCSRPTSLRLRVNRTLPGRPLPRRTAPPTSSSPLARPAHPKASRSRTGAW